MFDRLERLSRDPRLLRALGGVAVTIALVGAVAVGPTVWDRFSNAEREFPDNPEDHFGNLGDAGRTEYWRVALQGFSENPALGTGAGTYFFTWRAEREFDQPVQDAHSVYLEALSELGLPGALLILGVILVLIGIGLRAWDAGLRADRERTAVMVAAMVAFAVAAGVDWYWEFATLSGLFFMAAGLVVAERSSQLTRPAAAGRPEGGPEPEGPPRIYGVGIAGVAIGWISIAIMVGPMLMEHELRRSQTLAADGDIAAAANHALTARSLQPWAASPYVQLGGLAELEGNLATARDHYHEASERESDNWVIWYLMSQVASAEGDQPSADEYFERARELNPLAPEFADTD